MSTPYCRVKNEAEFDLFVKTFCKFSKSLEKKDILLPETCVKDGIEQGMSINLCLNWLFPNSNWAGNLANLPILPNLPNSVKIKNPLNISNALNLHWEHFELSLRCLVWKLNILVRSAKFISEKLKCQLFTSLTAWNENWTESGWSEEKINTHQNHPI